MLIGQLRQVGKTHTAERYVTVMNISDVLRETSLLWEGGFRPNGRVRNLSQIERRMSEYFPTTCGDCGPFTTGPSKKERPYSEPFKYVYNGHRQTIKRDAPLKVIRQIRRSGPDTVSTMDFARDIHVFILHPGHVLYRHGLLKRKICKAELFSYRRQKTGQQLFVKWEKPMQEIVDKYNTNGTPLSAADNST